MTPSSERNAQLVRALNILRDLDRLGGVDVYELAERYGATTRTIRRDLVALRDAGLPLVEEQDGKRKRWRVGAREKLRQLDALLDASHYLALRLAMGQGGPVRSASAVFASLEDLSAKIEGAVGARGRARLAAIDACFHSYEKFAYRASPPDVFWPLIEAITQRRVCRVTYRAARERPRDKRFEVLPLKLFAHQGGLYLMCHVLAHDSIATLNLQRLRGLQVLAKTGAAPPDFLPDALESNAFGVFAGGRPLTYVLRFSASVATFIRERVWHPSQKLTPIPRGGVELSFTCGESYEVDAWVASWMDGVEVVSPASLRQRLARLGVWLSSKYRRSDVSPRGPSPKGRRARKITPRR